MSNVTSDVIRFAQLKFTLEKCRNGEFDVGRNDVLYMYIYMYTLTMVFVAYA